MAQGLAGSVVVKANTPGGGCLDLNGRGPGSYLPGLPVMIGACSATTTTDQGVRPVSGRAGVALNLATAALGLEVLRRLTDDDDDDGLGLRIHPYRLPSNCVIPRSTSVLRDVAGHLPCRKAAEEFWMMPVPPAGVGRFTAAVANYKTGQCVGSPDGERGIEAFLVVRGCAAPSAVVDGALLPAERPSRSRRPVPGPVPHTKLCWDLVNPGNGFIATATCRPRPRQSINEGSDQLFRLDFSEEPPAGAKA